jgi:ABC-type Na+ efflux pump permease subunit
MSTFILAAKDLRLLLRDYRSATILLATPLVFVGVLSLVVGEGFGQKPDDRLRVSIVNLDEPLPPDSGPFPGRRWSDVVLDDLAGTADIRIEIIGSREEANRLIRDGKRSAVLIFEPDFSEKMHRTSFLTKGKTVPLNPMYRDGINPAKVSLTIIKDPTQQAAASIIEQVAQVTLFRVVIPWMIGKAFAQVGDQDFMLLMQAKLNEKKEIPGPVLKELDPTLRKLLANIFADPKFDELLKKRFPLIAGVFKAQIPQFQELIRDLFKDDEFVARIGKGIAFGEMLQPGVQKEMGPQVQDGVGEMFSQFDFHSPTWAGLTRNDPNLDPRGTVTQYEEEGGLPKRGSLRFQILVPSYTVTFSFFLVLTVGWLFAAERRQGTLVRLRAAPLTKAQLLMGKFIPALSVALFQGVFLMVAGRVIFGVSWGGQGHWVLGVVAATAFAATGMAMLAAVIAKTESQVAIYGTLLVLVLAGIGGSMMPRDLMPENMRAVSHITPHAWALDAYQQLLLNPDPNIGVVAGACAALLGFGAVFMALAWWRMPLD